MNKIFICLLFLSKTAVAQFYDSQKAIPSYFDNFIKKESVEWAAYINDTVRFNTINISELLRTRFKANEIKVAVPDPINTFEPDRLQYATKRDVQYYGALEVPSYDSAGNILPPSKANDDVLFSPHQFDSGVFNLLDITQLFYIHEGNLITYVPFVSPKKSIITSLGVNLGQADFFVTAFNFDYKYTNSRKDKIIDLGETHKLIQVDSIEKPYGSHILKQLYGRNIVETLWPYILNGKLKVTALENSKELSLKELDELANQNEKIRVPVYDSTGEFLQNDSMYRFPISPTVFKQIEVRQHWFYNQTKNIVFNKITQLVFYQNLVTDTGFEDKFKPVFKIVFK